MPNGTLRKLDEDGHVINPANRCHACALLTQRNARRDNNNVIGRRYEKTVAGFLVRAYRNMKSRVSGVTKNKNHLYLGLEILDKKRFYEWSLASEEFSFLFCTWEDSGHQRKLTPSIDRIDSKKGYTLSLIHI
jgi:hypothetical protein